MITKTKKGDFIEIDYTGIIKEENMIFDVTDEKIAKQNNIYHKEHTYRPITICLGKKDVVNGLDNFLIDKEINKEYELEIQPEDAFGKKQQELIKLLPTSVFTKQNIQPYPGLQVNLNNLIAIIKTVSGGRTLVDFNHPLAGKTLFYRIRINKIITDTKERLSSILEQVTKNFNIEIKEKEATITSDIKDKNMKKELEKEIKDRIPEISSIIFMDINKEKISTSE